MAKKRMVGIRVKPRLWQAAKTQAYAEGKTLEAWLEGAIRTQLANSEKSQPGQGYMGGNPQSRGHVGAIPELKDKPKLPKNGELREKGLKR